MHPIPIHAPWLLLASALLFSACSGGSKASPRTGALTLSATTADPTSGPVVIPLGIPLGSGQLAIDSALLHVGDLEIEMRRGRRHSQRGAGGVHAVEDEGEGHENEGENEGENENEVVDELRLAGPFTFDLAAGPTVLDSVPVVPGTFDRVDLRFFTATEAPLAGASILIRGAYTSSSASVPFTLRTDFDGSTHVPIANGGITVTANSVVPVELAFDLAAMFASLDFAGATVEGGEILIDATHNPALLLTFETVLHGCVGGHERNR